MIVLYQDKVCNQKVKPLLIRKVFLIFESYLQLWKKNK